MAELQPSCTLNQEFCLEWLKTWGGLTTSHFCHLDYWLNNDSCHSFITIHINGYWCQVVETYVVLCAVLSRPRKFVPCSSKTFLNGEDPYLMECVTDKMFPHLTLEQSGAKALGGSGGPTSTLQLVTLREGDKSITLPSLSIEQNYPQMLSELVMNIWWVMTAHDGILRSALRPVCTPNCVHATCFICQHCLHGKCVSNGLQAFCTILAFAFVSWTEEGNLKNCLISFMR